MIELDPRLKTPLYEQLYAALADEIRDCDWSSDVCSSDLRKNSYATRLRAAITPMMLIFCTVNFVLVKAATRSEERR